MKTSIRIFSPALIAAALLAATMLFADEKPAANVGGEKFKLFCAMCHPDGGNIVNPKKTLHKADREANKVLTPEDIIKRMRNPGPGMTKFSEKVLPDDQAQAIAQYVLKTFN